jgi:hypothetical protein
MFVNKNNNNITPIVGIPGSASPNNLSPVKKILAV